MYETRMRKMNLPNSTLLFLQAVWPLRLAAFFRIALYFLQKWLMKYDYRITIGPGVFIISAVAAIVITLLTISVQSIKAALANPVRSLKNE